VVACGPAVDAELVLDGYNLDIVDVQELGGTPIRVQLLFIDFETNARWVLVAFRPVIYRANGALSLRIFSGNFFSNIRCEGGNASTTRHVVAKEGDIFGIRWIGHASKIE